jgi:signal transduction histidine kinase
VTLRHPPKPDDPVAARHFPFLGWFLLAAAVASLLIVFLGWHIYESHRFFGQIGTDFARQTEAITGIRALRWELTQAAHHVVLFGDGEGRRETYDDAARRLAAELDAGRGLPRQAGEPTGFASLAGLAEKLGATEREAMDAARAGRQEEALDLLHSRQYLQGTRTLCAEADAHARAVYDRLRERLRSHGRSELVFFSIDVGVLLFAAALWWLLGVRLRTWRARAGAELSKRRDTEEKLRQAQKMEALGQMAAGVGHDFKNVLGAIIGYADLALRAAGQGRVDEASLKGIEAAAQQGAAVTGALLTFSHNTKPERQPVDLCALLKDTTELLRRMLPAPTEIAVRMELPADRCRIMGDRTQLQQLLINLALNAGDAMPTGGTLTIALTPDEGKGGEAPDGAGSGVCLTVSDTGKGIAPEISDRIFEPFFTTKARGQSTGLGLAIVHAVAVEHGARVAVSSVPGEGATFRVCFPRGHEVPAAAPVAVEGSRGAVLIASRDPYEAQLLVSAIGRLGLVTERVADWAALVADLQQREAATVVMDAGFSPLGAGDCSRTLAATRASPRVLVLAERDDASVREYEDAGCMVLERPLALAELIRLIDGNRAGL